MAIETWQDAIGHYVKLRGFDETLLTVRHIHADVWSGACLDLRPAYGPPNQPAACVCEWVEGPIPDSWERVIPWGKFYRFRAVDLDFLSPLEVLAFQAE